MDTGLTNNEGQPTKPPPLKVHIRWMVRADMPEVFAIENASFRKPWSEETFLSTLRVRNIIGMVAEHSTIREDGRPITVVVGYMVYSLGKRWIDLLSFAVHPQYRRGGVGSAIIRKVQSKLRPQDRAELRIRVAETELEAQQFLRALAIRAEKVEPAEDSDTGYAYLFVHREEVPLDDRLPSVDCGGDGEECEVAS